jgi:hypothetical protein
MDSITVDSLTTYEVADDGSGVSLHFVDPEGRAQALLLPLASLRQLTLSLPKIMQEALCASYRDATLRLVHAVASWVIERASDGKNWLVTFTTADHFSISFAVTDSDLDQLSASLNDYELEAFPNGLRVQ